MSVRGASANSEKNPSILGRVMTEYYTLCSQDPLMNNYDQGMSFWVYNANLIEMENSLAGSSEAFVFDLAGHDEHSLRTFN